MKRSIELYGALKDGGLGTTVELDLGKGATAAEAISLLKGLFGKKASLLQGAVLATETEVLAGSDLLPKSQRLAALPPVCGG
jgi:molybdopterin converting factor small subunit